MQNVFYFFRGCLPFLLGTLVILCIHQTLISMNKETSIDLKKAMEKKHQ